MKYLENQRIAAAIDAAPQYQKSALTGLRSPSSDEIGTSFTTYVKLKDGDGIRAESQNTVTDEHVVARNPDPIGKDESGRPVYNEWLIEKAVAVKNYTQGVVDGLTDNFTEHRKASLIKAIPLNRETLDSLGVEGDTLEITVDWSPDPMVAKIGDFITDGGYSISAHDMKTTYISRLQSKVECLHNGQASNHPEKTKGLNL